MVVGFFSLGLQNRALAARFAIALAMRLKEGKIKACVSCCLWLWTEAIGGRRWCDKVDGSSS